MTSHDPTEDQRIAAVVREHFTAHERSQEPAVMQTPDNVHERNVQTRTLPKLSELTRDQILALSDDELHAIFLDERCDPRVPTNMLQPYRAQTGNMRPAEYLASLRLQRQRFEFPLPTDELADSTAMVGAAELAPEVPPARAPRQRPRAVKLARRVGIVLAWLLLLVALAVVSGLAQVSVVLGQQALVSDGVGPLAAAGVAAICSIVVGLGALAVLGKLADRLCEVET